MQCSVREAPLARIDFFHEISNLQICKFIHYFMRKSIRASGASRIEHCIFLLFLSLSLSPFLKITRRRNLCMKYNLIAKDNFVQTAN